MREFHILSSACFTKSPDDFGNESCQFYPLMAFVVPFMALTITGLVCQSYSIIVAPTIGLLAGCTSFGLYSAIKSTLRSVRATVPIRVDRVEAQY
ncbi:hypothetical protein KF707_06300 [Candidatus Obscuribacterales bacterium]|nr:hypothetical protein [Candidatus Obscuribacterales bacterium]MBX3148522.1 hypothetical protein [Candidatus Obscuribacterales bacterium]